MQSRPLPTFPSSSGCDGPVAAAWQLVRTGSLRAAASMLAALDVVPDLTQEQAAAVSALRLETVLAAGHVEDALAGVTPLKRKLVRVTGPAATQVATTLHLALGQVDEAIGDHPGALSHFTAAGFAGGDDALRPWRAGAAVALVRTGRRREGATLAAEQVELATRAHDARALAMGLRTQAITGAMQPPIEILRRACAIASGSGDRRLLAQLETDLAALLLISGREGTAEPVALLRSAERYTLEECLWPAHARVVRLLGHLGETPRQPVDDLVLLTPAERRTARLAADGLTNRQIAERLAITIKGVEWHLSRVYKKLDIGSRADLRRRVPPWHPAVATAQA